MYETSENKIGGLHHIAVATADIKVQIEFCTDVLGMELVALYWMHGVKDTWHGFLRLNDESSIAFVQNPEIAKTPIELGKTHAGNPAGNCAPGTMQHLSLRVQDKTELLAMRDRLRAKGVPVLGPADHGMSFSIYFAGPDSISFELACSDEPIDQEAWIDPEVVALAGISEDELSRYKNPPAFEDSGGDVEQPDLEGPGPHMTNYPPGVYEKVLGLPDDVVLSSMESDPPVSIEKK
jgi:catechol 2,3-dioxygenase-like lactoylglutathione lyase family enzyme